MDEEEPNESASPLDTDSNETENGNLQTVATQLYSSAYNHAMNEVLTTNIEEDDF